MHKQTVIDQIEITRDGSVQIRMAKEVIDDDGSVLSQEWHRTSLPPGGDIDLQMATVNEHLTTGLNCAPVEASDIARVKSYLPIAWTPEVLTRHAAKVEEQAEAIQKREGDAVPVKTRAK